MVIPGRIISSAKKGGISREKRGVYQFKYLILIVLLNLSYLISVLGFDEDIEIPVAEKNENIWVNANMAFGKLAFLHIAKKRRFFHQN